MEPSFGPSLSLLVLFCSFPIVRSQVWYNQYRQANPFPSYAKNANNLYPTPQSGYNLNNQSPQSGYNLNNPSPQSGYVGYNSNNANQNQPYSYYQTGLGNSQNGHQQPSYQQSTGQSGSINSYLLPQTTGAPSFYPLNSGLGQTNTNGMDFNNAPQPSGFIRENNNLAGYYPNNGNTQNGYYYPQNGGYLGGYINRNNGQNNNNTNDSNNRNYNNLYFPNNASQTAPRSPFSPSLSSARVNSIFGGANDNSNNTSLDKYNGLRGSNNGGRAPFISNGAVQSQTNINNNNRPFGPSASTITNPLIEMIQSARMAAAQRSAADAAICYGPTTSDSEGPFYIMGSPYKQNTPLCTDSERDPLTISGMVMDETCTTPVSKATIEFWQARFDGTYTGVLNGKAMNPNTVRLSTEDYDCRGKLDTSPDGQYKLNTVYPGVIPGRPRHINFKVSAPGYQDLTSQMYFDDDEFRDVYKIPTFFFDMLLSKGCLGCRQQSQLARVTQTNRNGKITRNTRFNIYLRRNMFG